MTKSSIFQPPVSACTTRTLAPDKNGQAKTVAIEHQLPIHKHRDMFAHTALIVKYVVTQNWRGKQGCLQHRAQITGKHLLRRALDVAKQIGCKFNSDHGIEPSHDLRDCCRIRLI